MCSPSFWRGKRVRERTCFGGICLLALGCLWIASRRFMSTSLTENVETPASSPPEVDTSAPPVPADEPKVSIVQKDQLTQAADEGGTEAATSRKEEAEAMKATEYVEVADWALLPATIKVWPLPQIMSYSVDGVSLSLHSELEIHATSQSPILKEGIKRYDSFLQSISKMDTEPECANNNVKMIEITLEGDDESLSLDTSYNFTVTVDAATGIVIHADTPFGALYGLETVSQLFADGCLKHSHVHIEDYPDYRHRGFMLDTGRRFVPKELLLNFLEGMSYVKLNVFHWHLSDWCIFSIESKVFPTLTSCYDKEERYYTQEDAKEVLQYATNRGIRIIPEIDIPGHAGGMRCLTGDNMHFCNEIFTQVQNDAGGQTLAVLKKLFEEIIGIFPDKYVHIGADETSFSTKCNFESVHNLETDIAKFLVDKGRIPMAWQEAFDGSKVDVPSLVVQSWTGNGPGYYAEKGYASIESRKEWYYFDSPYGPRDHWYLWNSPVGMKDTNSPHHHLVLGGEFAMWGDLYTKVWQCGHWPDRSRIPNAHWLHDKVLDEHFMDSMSGQVWPRGVALAGRFWHHVEGLEKQVLGDRVDHQGQILISRGVRSCPIGCVCDCKTRCGKEYPRSP